MLAINMNHRYKDHERCEATGNLDITSGKIGVIWAVQVETFPKPFPKNMSRVELSEKIERDTEM